MLNLFWDTVSGYRFCFFLADKGILWLLYTFSTLDAVCAPLSFLVRVCSRHCAQQCVLHGTTLLKKKHVPRVYFTCRPSVFSCDVLCSWEMLVLLSEHAVSSLASNYGTNCWCVSPLCFDPDDNLFLIFQSFPTHCASQYKHVSSVGLWCITFSLPAFFSPTWPLLCTASVTMYTLITSKPFRSLLSFVLMFSVFVRLSSGQDTHIFYSPLLFFFFSP